MTDKTAVDLKCQLCQQEFKAVDASVYINGAVYHDYCFFSLPSEKRGEMILKAYKQDEADDIYGDTKDIKLKRHILKEKRP